MDLIARKTGKTWRSWFGETSFPCAIGRNGVVPADQKKEGDGKSPLGRWSLVEVLYRPDRVEIPRTTLPLRPLKKEDGWCDAPEHAAYNSHVTLPFDASHEVMWRDDPLYDIVVVLNHNLKPAIPGRGSAIFLHCAKPGFPPTAGCLALVRSDLELVLRSMTTEDAVVFEG